MLMLLRYYRVIWTVGVVVKMQMQPKIVMKKCVASSNGCGRDSTKKRSVFLGAAGSKRWFPKKKEINSIEKVSKEELLYRG